MLSKSQSLRETNQRMGAWFDAMVAKSVRVPLATPEQMAAIISELLGTGARLRAEPLPTAVDDPELHIQVERYRLHLERLLDFLPSLQRQLLAERARLENERVRVRAAAEWARASRQIL